MCIRGVASLLSSLLLVLATSLDGFSAGVAYGLRRVSFPWQNRAVVAAISIGMMGIGMGLGRAAGSFFPVRWARLAGGLMLILLGAWMVLRGIAPGKHGRFEAKIWSWRVPSLGLVVQILREPIDADLDASGTISLVEAVWLGFALSIDALAAGFCANLGMGLPSYLPIPVGIVNWIFIGCGIYAGGLFHREKMPLMAALPGMILMIIGVWRFI